MSPSLSRIRDHGKNIWNPGIGTPPPPSYPTINLNNDHDNQEEK